MGGNRWRVIGRKRGGLCVGKGEGLRLGNGEWLWVGKG